MCPTVPSCALQKVLHLQIEAKQGLNSLLEPKKVGQQTGQKHQRTHET